MMFIANGCHGKQTYHNVWLGLWARYQPADPSPSLLDNLAHECHKLYNLLHGGTKEGQRALEGVRNGPTVSIFIQATKLIPRPIFDFRLLRTSDPAIYIWRQKWIFRVTFHNCRTSPAMGMRLRNIVTNTLAYFDSRSWFQLAQFNGGECCSAKLLFQCGVGPLVTLVN